MKNQIVMISAFLVVMMAMTGIASAFQLQLLDVNNNTVPLKIPMIPGQSMDFNVKISDYNHDSPDFHIKNLSNPTYVIIETHPQVILTGGMDPYIQPNALTITLTSNAEPDHNYFFELNVTECLCQMEFQITGREIHAVPEFPTVALPIAAVIGLVFFFQKRKIN
ncbi:Uncharacterised protein [uncultured archaeon]|nr:Uncharacterised protein [uncultured archaeon]